MGLFGRRKIRTPVEAQAHVLATGQRPSSSVETVTMRLRIEAPGREPWEVRHQCRAYRSQWPEPGDVLPAVFDADDPKRLKVDVGQARLRDALPFEVQHEHHEQQITYVELNADGIKDVERQTGIDLDGDGRVG